MFFTEDWGEQLKTCMCKVFSKIAKFKFHLFVFTPRARLNANHEIGIIDVLANLMVELFAGHFGVCDCKIRHFQLKAMDGVSCHLLQGKRLGVIAL